MEGSQWENCNHLICHKVSFLTGQFWGLCQGMKTIDKFHMSQALPSSFLSHHQVCNYSSTTGATNGEGTAYPSGATEFTPVFGGGSCYSILSLVFYVRKSFEVISSTWPIGTLGSVVSLLAATLFHEILIETTSSGMSDQLRDMYSICTYC
jgi:hypothetical protein